jgi:hypothetical protein
MAKGARDLSESRRFLAVIAPETELSLLRSPGRDDRWVPVSATEEEGEGNDSEREGNGPWAVFGCGLESVPGALSSFSFSFLFSFLFLFVNFCK